MKRRTLTASLAAAAALAACSPQAAPATPTVAKATKQGTYYFLAGNNSDPFYVPGVKGFKDACASVGYQGEFVGPMDMNIAEHVRIFEQLNASAETAGIFLYPWDPNAQTPLIKEAKKKGIPLVVGAADMVGKDRDAFIGYDNTLLGQQAAAFADSILGGKGTVGTIGNKGANVVERTTAFASALKAKGYTIIQHQLHDGSADSAQKAIDAYLVANPTLDLFWFADGAAGQMAQPWKERQQTGAKCRFLATDMPDATLKAVKDGVFVGSVGQDTYTEAYWGVLLLDQIRQGRRVPDTLSLSAILLDKSNVAKFQTI